MSLGPASRVREHEGWLWLEPRPRSLTAGRLAVTGVALAALLVVLAIVPLLPPALPAAVVVPAMAALALVAVAWVLFRWWRVAWARVGASEIGVMLQAGGSTEVYGWTAVEQVQVRPRPRGRVEVLVGLDDRTVAAPATFEAAAAAGWMRAAAALAPDDVVWRSE